MTSSPLSAEEQLQKYYARKLYALLRDPIEGTSDYDVLKKRIPELDILEDKWWDNHGQKAADIGSASDRISLEQKESTKSNTSQIEVRHPISGQRQTIAQGSINNERIQRVINVWNSFPTDIPVEKKLKQLFLWCWRFYPELRDQSTTALLNPAHRILPDCPIPSYNSTVSALTGAMFPSTWSQDSDQEERPYLLLFTFSPVQEFIKASRKFADFWSGSYMLHYLSARLCWKIAQDYGPDAVITPSLWGQEIIDALLVKDFPEFTDYLGGEGPVKLFESFESHSLSTAGFPNTITAVVPKQCAIALGQTLQKELKEIWQEIAKNVREHIKARVLDKLAGNGVNKTWEDLKSLFPVEEHETYKKELTQLSQHGCWEWNSLWEAQIDNTWQPYFVTFPLGSPDVEMVCEQDLKTWINHQNIITQPSKHLPTKAEEKNYQQKMNVGTWWGSLQGRLGLGMKAVKNTRRWQIPVAPGERSSLSGQFSALHPRLLYKNRFKHGRGMASGSMRMFWKLMAISYPGLFDGSEKLNALEITKRMAWIYGDVADELGIKTSKKLIKRIQKHRQTDSKLQWDQADRLVYERFSRFPNLSSIAAARFLHDHKDQAQTYLEQLQENLQSVLLPQQKSVFNRITQKRPTQLPKTDKEINPNRRWREHLNGVMFSSKWLLEDLNVSKDQISEIRSAVAQAHKDANFGENSPADWWVLLLADGDSMGQYVSGNKLKNYKDYLIQDLVDTDSIDDPKDWEGLLTTPKRMGPATHVGLNRALLDFSNRLVPHLTEHRYCGRVIYSGGDDVLVALPLADLPGFLRSLQAAWCGSNDPDNEFKNNNNSGYWRPPESMTHLPQRPLFTMGQGATMSMGMVIAHKSVPLPTVLENLWEAESDRAKKLLGGQTSIGQTIKPKDGLCFRVVYGSGNTLEALMKGHLLELWWEIVKPREDKKPFDLSPLLNRLAEDLPKHVAVTASSNLCRVATEAILRRREDQIPEQFKDLENALLNWVQEWERWAWAAKQQNTNALGTDIEDLARLMRFTAFWISRRRQELSWVESEAIQTEKLEVTHG